MAFVRVSPEIERRVEEVDVLPMQSVSTNRPSTAKS